MKKLSKTLKTIGICFCFLTSIGCLGLLRERSETQRTAETAKTNKKIAERADLRELDAFCSGLLQSMLKGEMTEKSMSLTRDEGISYNYMSTIEFRTLVNDLDRYFEGQRWQKIEDVDLPLTSVVSYANENIRMTFNYGYFGAGANYSVACYTKQVY